MARFDVHTQYLLNGRLIAKGKTRESGDNAIEAFKSKMLSLGMIPEKDKPKLDILGLATKRITVRYPSIGLEIVSIPVDDEKGQCDDCGWPEEMNNPDCDGQCKERRERGPDVIIDIDEANEILANEF